MIESPPFVHRACFIYLRCVEKAGKVRLPVIGSLVLSTPNTLEDYGDGGGGHQWRRILANRREISIRDTYCLIMSLMPIF